MQFKTAAIVAAILVLGGFGYFYMNGGMPSASDSSFDTQEPAPAESETTYACAGGKTVTAGFSDRIVTVALSDGRSITLEQVVSASGARYANNGEEVVFWDKAGNAFVEENGEVTYENCIAGGEPQEPAMEGMMIDGTPEEELDTDMIDAGVEATGTIEVQ